MPFRFPLLLLLLSFCTCVRAQTPEFSFLSTEQNAFVRQEVARLSLKQKAGQMTQVAADLLFEGKVYSLTKPLVESAGRQNNVFSNLEIGSILNHPTGAYPGPEQWYAYMKGWQQQALDKTGVPILYGIDAIHGPNYVSGSTLYAQPLGVAASFNAPLAQELAAMTAYELMAASIPWNFSPAMDVPRNPVWSRNWESFGEDTYLNTAMGLAMVKGYQGDDPSSPYTVAACLKHFTGYGAGLSGRDRTPAYVAERQLREHWFPQYQATIDAGALTIMINSGELNGIPVHAHKWLLTDVLRSEMGFEGLLVSDWQDVRYLYERHKVARDLKEAVKMSIDAGMDMSMTAVTTEFPQAVIQLVNEGQITMDRIDLSVARILAVKVALGLYEQSSNDPADYPKFGGAEFDELSMQSAEEAVVLLKNDGLPLPIKADQRVLVTGPTANTMRSLNGGWTYSWQGQESDDYLGDRYNTILEAMQSEFPDRISYVPGVAYDTVIDIAAAVEAAGEVDIIVACMGELSYTENPGNINDLNLPSSQNQLIEALGETGKPIILVYAGGRTRIITDMARRSKAVLFSIYPGPHGGDAIAGIISGRVNPSARLPVTYPRYVNAFTYYDRKHTEDFFNAYNPLFEFGHGLSYSTFTYGNLKLSAATMGPNDSVRVSVTVTNSGKRAGKHSVLLFSSDKIASITPSVKKLRAFDKVSLEPGESKEVNFTLTAEDLSFIGLENKRITETGAFTIMVGDKEATLTYGE